MPHKDHSNYSWITYLWIMVLSIWGGTAHTIRKVRMGIIKHFSISEWIGDMVIASFLGIITFYLCEYANIQAPLNAVFIAISAHQGTRGIALLEKYIFEKFKIKE